MSRFFFNSQNQVGETHRFPTDKNGAFYWYIDKHVPGCYPAPRPLAPGCVDVKRSHRFDFGDGSLPYTRTSPSIPGYSTTNADLHTYLDSSDKWFTIETDKLEEVRYFSIGFNNNVNNVFTGKTNLDLTPFKKIYHIQFSRNTNITGVTFNTSGEQPLANFYGDRCDLTGTLDLSSLNLTDASTLYLHTNPNLDKIIFPSTSGTSFVGNNYVYNCNLSGHYDFSDWVAVANQFNWRGNDITGFTFPTIEGTSGGLTSGFIVYQNQLTGTLDLSMLKECGRIFEFFQNFNLTEIILPSNTRNCITFNGSTCDLRHLDVSGLSGLTVTSTSPSTFQVGNNFNLSGITTTDGLNRFNNGDWRAVFELSGTDIPYFDLSGSTFSNTSPVFINLNACPSLSYFRLPVHPKNYITRGINCRNCPNLTNIDISAFDGGGGVITNTIPGFEFDACSLTGITTALTGKTGELHFNVGANNLTGTLDLSNYLGLMKFDISNNPGLTSLILPKTTSTRTLTDQVSNGFSIVFEATGCDLGYMDFKGMSGLTLNSSSTIDLQNNNMTAGEVNHILDDFTTTTWNDVTLDISGSNAAPDSSSGGYNGIAALSTLTGGTRNWNVTTS
jgi:hypothetical protein